MSSTPISRTPIAYLSAQVESSDEDDDDDDVNNGRRRKRQKTTIGRAGMHPVLVEAVIPLVDRCLHLAASTRDEVESPPSSLPESEDDIYGGQRGRTFAKKHRQKLQAAVSGSGTPNLSEVRFSTRRAAKVTTYNEDDDLGLSEEDTENMTPNYWTYTEDNSPAIDLVLNHRLKDGVGKYNLTT